MHNVYIVVSRIYEYDEENNEGFYAMYEPGSKVGFFEKCFLNRKDAKKYCKEKTAEFFEDNSVFNHAEEQGEEFVTEMGGCVQDFLNQFGFETSEMLDTLPDIYTNLFVPLAIFRPYEIIKAKIE